ncbi:AAA family ATPase [Photobacterium sp. Alg240-V54]|uniref:AAA family ATPase n=1 Tax=Photobacterium sp. Alg240-V54 TaxID=2305995 RepID=UPI0013D1AF71|nr:AAA family ATPase [Photobacterium sp. Alg240-V54]
MKQDSSFSIRVTSISSVRGSNVIFHGVLIKDGFKRATNKKYLMVIAPKCLLPMMPIAGQHWYIIGKAFEETVEHNKIYFKKLTVNATRLKVIMPECGDHFVNFIAKDPEFGGIAEVKARLLWYHFKTEVYKILNEKNVERLTEVLSSKIAKKMINGWEKYSNLKWLHWFSEHGVSPEISARIIKHHSEKTIQRIQGNPYVLQTFGMSFSAVDVMAKQYFFVKDDDPRRLISAVREALYKRTNSGHTIAEYRDVKAILNRVLNNSELAKQALMLSHENIDFIIDNDGNYHPTGTLLMEKTVAYRFLDLANKTDFWGGIQDEALAFAIQDLPFPLLEKQVEAVCDCMVNSISILTGGAGTGKTTTLRVILRSYQKMGYKIFPMALSGRASKRIRESTGFPASTIAGFLKNAQILDDDLAIIVIDEASMVDLPTMYKIIMKLHCNVRILLSGDQAQLSPIGYGLILHEVVKTNIIKNNELNIVNRQVGSTGIPEFTLLIRNGIIPEFKSENITFHETQSSDLNEKIAGLYALNPAKTQIVAAVKNNDVGGIRQINTLCQNLCNSSGQRLKFGYFGENQYLDIRVGDPIIFNENNWDEDIQNGTMGRLVSVGGNDDKGTPVIGTATIDDGRTIKLTTELVLIMDLAYAITVHKSQGSQFPRVIVVLSNSRMIDRSWIYTALTRAEVNIEIVGTKVQFEQAIMRISSAEQRKTYLKTLLEISTTKS